VAANVMLVVKLLFLFVLLGEVRETVVNVCPASCSCSTTEATCINTSLTEFPGGRFPEQLQKLVISGNRITQLGAVTIRNWMIVSLKELNLSNNTINRIDGKSFFGQSGLEKLDLSGNEITTFPQDTFVYPPRLQWLSLANNSKLQMPEHSPLLESDSLQVLHLEYCSIEKISVTNLQKLGKLEELYLSHNRIKILSAERQEDLTSLKNIRILDLSYNQLQKLPPEIMTLPKLEKVDLRYNKFGAMCEVKTIGEFCET
jgi:Leucine-rich repeat (LRR) protein